MAFNGSGTFARLYSWTTEQLAGNPISSTKMDAEDAGFAAGLSNCITKDGQTTITNDIPMAGFKITGLGTPTATTDATTKTYVDSKTWGTSAIVDSAITAAKLATDSVTTTKIADDAVTTAKIDNAAVTEAKIDSSAVTEAKIGSAAVTADKIGTLAVTTTKIDNLAVTNAKIENGAVSFAKISDIDQYRVIGRVGSGTGDPGALDPDDLGTILGQASLAITLPVNVVTDTYNTGSTSGVGYQISTTGALRVQRPNSAADTDMLFGGYRGTTLNAQIEANGDFQSATNSYGATSDRSAKREIADMRSTLDQLAALPMRKGKLNHEYARDGDAAPEREFVIADEVESAGFGNLVKTNADGTKWVNYSGLYVKNIKATQELYAAHRALERRVAALEGR